MTWSASPAPSGRLVRTQRWCLAGGAVTRSWTSLVAANVAAVSVLLDARPVAAAALAVWAADVLVRANRLRAADSPPSMKPQEAQ